VHDIHQEQEQQAQVRALPSSVIQVGIADDHPIVRRALRWCIDQNTDMHVAGEASTGREAIELVRTVAIDVLLLDVDMPGRSGMDALATIKSSSRRRTLGVLMLSSYPEDVYAVPLIRAGASGYVGKSCPPEEIGAAIRHIASGRRWITPAVAELLADEAAQPAAQSAHKQLSMRELQLLLKLARGCSTSEAAADLSLSPKTMSAVRSGLLRKLMAHSNSDLTHYALKHRLLV
jgi:two-component system, NarL family, invasion response regulator UvrY